MFNLWKYLAAAFLAVLLHLSLVGCMAIHPAGELKELLADPAVQSSLDRWSANASIHNPAFEAYLINGVGIRVVGADVTADVSGDARSKGLSAEQLAALAEIEAKRKAVLATQPSQ